MPEAEQAIAGREATFAAFAEHVNRGKVATFREMGLELVMGRRSGAYFWDAFDGTRFFDCHCNGGVFNLGHRNALVIDAVSEALERMDIGNHHLVSEARASLAERLAASTDGQLPGVVFGVGGGEAIDLAIKLARGHRRRPTIVSAAGGFHGHTGLATAAGDPEYREPFGPNLPGFVQVPFNDLDAMAAAVDDETAAVLLEPIPATLGMAIPDEGFLAEVERICHDRGALLILDEVQTGLGRTGSVWCFTQDRVRPDMVVTGKGLSGGVYPISATMMSAELHGFFDTRPFVHLSTFGGAEPGCAAATAVLDAIEAPGFLERVRALGERFERDLAGLPLEVRRRGLFMGLRFPEPEGGVAAATRLFEAGVFAVWANNDRSVLQFLPPLVITDDEVDELVAIVRRTLG
jgi:acetylornithine/succinyldiaminopimelate/putrescine aminotransferase